MFREINSRIEIQNLILFSISIAIGLGMLILTTRILWKLWPSTSHQKKLIPQNPWASLIWLTLVIRDGVPEYREKTRHLMLNIDKSILLSGVLTALLFALQETNFIDRSRPLLIENKNRVSIYIRFRKDLTYVFITSPKKKFVFESYSRLFIRSYERYHQFFGDVT
ncbi:MAG: hypothetical protein ACXADY_08050 [Candidatus Hodarchaeales archaeon]|jgi:hypothetical protein